MGLTTRHLAVALVLLGFTAITIAIALLWTPPAGLLVLGVGAVALGMEELLR